MPNVSKIKKEGSHTSGQKLKFNARLEPSMSDSKIFPKKNPFTEHRLRCVTKPSMGLCPVDRSVALLFKFA